MPLTLTQAEADALIAMPKRATDEDVKRFPSPGDRLTSPLISLDRTEDFLLDVSRSRIDFTKGTYQNRAHLMIVLMRLDLNGAPHRNPDGTQVACPHLHVYKEGFGDKWAYPISDNKFTDLRDLLVTFSDFLRLCNVVEPPIVQAGLF